MSDIADLLRSRGFRVTAARRLVWDAVDGAERHLTALEIADRVRSADPGVNLSSIYRSLNLFSELELIRESQFGVDGASRWEPAHADNEFHLVCSRCGEVEHHPDAIVERIRDHLADGHGFAAASIEVVATGVCGRCRGAARLG